MQVPSFYLFCIDEAQALPELSSEIYFLQILNGLREIGAEGAVGRRWQAEEEREPREQVSSSGGQVSSGSKIEWPSLTPCSSPSFQIPTSVSDAGDGTVTPGHTEAQGHTPCLPGNLLPLPCLHTQGHSWGCPCPSHPVLSLPKPALGLPASSPARSGDVGVSLEIQVHLGSWGGAGPWAGHSLGEAQFAATDPAESPGS